MDQNATRTDRPQAENAKAGGCCGGRDVKPTADVRPQPQPPVTRTGGCCCSKR